MTMNTYNTRTYYLRSIPRQGQKRGDPIACLMTSIDRAGNVIKYSIATMHPKDDFKKNLGRKIAEGRLKEHPAIVFVESMPTSGHVISRLIMADIVARFEQVSKFQREYIMRTYGNNWAYHIPARVAKAAKQWIDDANKPRPTEMVKTYTLEQKEARVFTQKDLTSSYTGSITCDMKDAKVWTEEDLRGKSDKSIMTEVVNRMYPKPTTPKGFIKYGDGDNVYGEWVKNGKDFVRQPAQEVSAPVKKTPKSLFTSEAQQANYEVFQKALPDMLTNKFLKGRFAIVSGKQIKSFFDSYKTALQHALIEYKAGEFIIQEVAVNVMPIVEQKSA